MVNTQAEINDRTIKVAIFIVNTNASIRATAKAFGISRATVHADVTKRLPNIDSELAKKVKNVLQQNKAMRQTDDIFDSEAFELSEIDKRDAIIEEAKFIIENNVTLRQAEEYFKVSRSTLSRDISQRLSKIDPVLAKKANAVLQENKADSRNRANAARIAKKQK